MKAFCSLLLLIPMFAATANAQVEQGKIEGELRRFEFAINPYSYAQLDGDNLHGFNANLGIHVVDQFAIVMDFSLNRTLAEDLFGLGDSHVEVFAVRVGPRFTARSGRTSLFFQILAGAMHHRDIFNVDLLGSPQRVVSTQHGWAGLAGGGIDIGLTDWMSLRAFQADYNTIEVDGSFLHGVRLGAGLMFHLH